MGRKDLAGLAKERRTSLLAMIALAGALCVGQVGAAYADGFGPGQQRPGHKQAQKRAAAPQQLGQTGEIPLAGGRVKLTVPANYYFVPASEARAHLQRIGAPAPSGEVLGMVAPAGVRAIDDNFWGAVISLNPLGHVAEERAERLREDDFIHEVRGARAAGPRLEAFSARPQYDATRKVSTWSERYPAGPATSRTLRNESRLLGRTGVVGVTIDARANQAAAVDRAAPEITRMVSFAPGQTYADYAPASDGAPLYDLPSLLTLKTRPAPAPATPVAEAPPPAMPAAEPAPPPVATVTEPVASGAKGIPAKSSGLQPINGTAEPASSTAAGLPSADMAKWMPWLAGALVALAVIPWLVGMARGRERFAAAEASRPRRRRTVAIDPNFQPTDAPPVPPDDQKG